MKYDLDAKIDEVAKDVAADEGFSVEDLRALAQYASNKHAARVFTRALELRTTTEELCRSTTSK